MWFYAKVSEKTNVALKTGSLRRLEHPVIMFVYGNLRFSLIVRHQILYALAR